MVLKAAILAFIVVLGVVLPASQSLVWYRAHMSAPLLWFKHQKYFLPSKVLMNALFALLSESLGSLPFHAQFFLVFFFCSFIFLGSAFLVDCALLVGFSLAFLVVIPQRSFFKELTSAVTATIFS